MHSIRTCSLFALVLVLTGCAARDRFSDRQIAMLAFSENPTLTWQQYDGAGDPGRAVYLLNDEELGTGNKGLRDFARVVAEAPPQQRFKIGVYYSPIERPQRRYPMNGNPLWQDILETARRRNVAIDYPTLVSRP